MPASDRLEADSAAWVAEGLISAEQRARILNRERGHERPARSLTTILSLTGAAVVVLGITLIVATNWRDIPLMTKLAAGVALLVALYAAGYWMRFGPLARAKSGDALMLIGAGVFLGDLALVSQQYHIFESFSVPLLLVWAAVAPMPYLLRSRAFAFVSAGVFAAWVGAEMARQGSPIRPHDPAQVFLVLAGVGTAILAAGTVHRLTRLARLGESIEIVGGAVLLFAVYMLGFYRHFLSYSNGKASLSAAVTALMIGVPALLVLAALAAEARSRRVGLALDRRRWPVYAGAALLLLVLAWSVLVALNPRGVAEQRFIVWTAGYWLLAIALTAELGWLGVALQRPGWLNAALIFAGLYTLTRYFDLFSSYGQTGLMFVGAGVLLIAVAFVLERSRRALTRLGEEPR